MNEAPRQGTELPPRTAARPAICWWPAAVILLAAFGVLLWIWGFYGRQRQDRNLATEITLVLTVALLLLWCLLLSRMRWRWRFAWLGGVAVLIGLTMALFRMQGVTGDLVPVLRWRWGHSAWSAPDASRPPGSTPTPDPATGLTNDYPQFLGPNRNGMVASPRLARDWKTQPPQRLWAQPVGTGWSGFAVAGHLAITLEQRGENETINAYDLLSGSPIWSYPYPAHFQSTLAGEGPRATPTIAGNRVYALGSSGLLNCLALDTGKLLWSKDILRDSQAELEVWGMSSSPLLVNDQVVVSAGGKNHRSLVAYRAADGEFAWGGGTDGAGYSSPLLADLAGVRQILIFNSGGVLAHDPSSGEVLWKYHWPGGHPHVSTPVVLPGDRLLVSSGYGVGSELLRVQKGTDGKWSASRIWKSNRLKAKFTNLVYRGDFIYGLDDGIMACLDATTGEPKWKYGRYGHGQEILVGDLLLVGAESGEMILLDPNPQAAREIARFSALHGKTWNPPALAGQYLVVRNDKEAACYRLPLAEP